MIGFKEKTIVGSSAVMLLLLRANQRHECVHVFIHPAARQEPASYLIWDISSVVERRFVKSCHIDDTQ